MGRLPRPSEFLRPEDREDEIADEQKAGDQGEELEHGLEPIARPDIQSSEREEDQDAEDH
jgi:hypothetical protein